MKELGRGTAYNTHNITSLTRTPQDVSDILQTEEAFTVEEYTHTHTHTHAHDHSFLFTAYADDSTFFLKGMSSVKMLFETFKELSRFSGLKPNITKCKIADLGPFKGVLETVCGLKTVI